MGIRTFLASAVVLLCAACSSGPADHAASSAAAVGGFPGCSGLYNTNAEPDRRVLRDRLRVLLESVLHRPGRHVRLRLVHPERLRRGRLLERPEQRGLPAGGQLVLGRRSELRLRRAPAGHQPGQRQVGRRDGARQRTVVHGRERRELLGAGRLVPDHHVPLRLGGGLGRPRAASTPRSWARRRPSARPAASPLRPLPRRPPTTPGHRRTTRERAAQNPATTHRAGTTRAAACPARPTETATPAATARARSA